jgi:peptidoglycan/LPS O-acetylase OafA/YrhL
LPANLALVHAWGFAPSASFNHPSWSISAEWFAYLTFPVFAAAAARLSNRPGLAVVGALALLFGLYAVFPRLTGFELTQATIAWGALRIVPCFALGCAVHLLWRSGALSRAGRARIGAATFGLAIVGLASVNAPDAFLTASFAGLIVSLTALWATRTQAGAPSRTLSIFSYLGEISYSTYMICVPWKILFLKFASIILGIPGETLPLGLWLIFLISLVPLSALSFHLVERPARAWMKQRVASTRGGATFQPAS